MRLVAMAVWANARFLVAMAVQANAMLVHGAPLWVLLGAVAVCANTLWAVLAALL